MTKKFISITCGLLLLLPSSMQAQSDYNPNLPPDPTPPVVKHALTVVCEPAAAGTASGKGTYEAGTSVTVATSPNDEEYTFSHWMLNGERYEAATSKSFSYTTVAGEMNFVAVYDCTPTPFEPSNPSDPFADVKSRLYLTSEPAGVCSFGQTSGKGWVVDSYVTVSVTNVDQQYEFEGWYLDGVRLTDVKSFSHQKAYADETLVARFTRLPDPEPEPEVPFDPENPDDPNMSDKQENVQTHAAGDVNKDGEINVADLTAIIKCCLEVDSEGISKKLADLNADGEVNVSDITLLIRIILQAKE